MKTNVGYSTNVVIKKYKAGQLISTDTYHNTGTWNLFNAICRALAGTSITSFCPVYLNLRYEGDDGKYSNSVLRYPAELVSIEISPTPTSGDGVLSTDEGCTLSLVFSLYGDNLIVFTGSQELYFTMENMRVSDTYADNILAVVDTGNTVSSFSLSEDEMLLVDWQTTFENEPKE